MASTQDSSDVLAQATGGGGEEKAKVEATEKQSANRRALILQLLHAWQRKKDKELTDQANYWITQGFSDPLLTEIGLQASSKPIEPEPEISDEEATELKQSLQNEINSIRNAGGFTILIHGKDIRFHTQDSGNGTTISIEGLTVGTPFWEKVIAYRAAINSLAADGAASIDLTWVRGGSPTETAQLKRYCYAYAVAYLQDVSKTPKDPNTMVTGYHPTKKTQEYTSQFVAEYQQKHDQNLIPYMGSYHFIYFPPRLRHFFTGNLAKLRPEKYSSVQLPDKYLEATRAGHPAVSEFTDLVGAYQRAQDSGDKAGLLEPIKKTFIDASPEIRAQILKTAQLAPLENGENLSVFLFTDLRDTQPTEYLNTFLACDISTQSGLFHLLDPKEKSAHIIKQNDSNHVAKLLSNEHLSPNKRASLLASLTIRKIAFIKDCLLAFNPNNDALNQKEAVAIFKELDPTFQNKIFEQFTPDQKIVYFSELSQDKKVAAFDKADSITRAQYLKDLTPEQINEVTENFQIIHLQDILSAKNSKQEFILGGEEVRKIVEVISDPGVQRSLLSHIYDIRADIFPFVMYLTKNHWTIEKIHLDRLKLPGKDEAGREQDLKFKAESILHAGGVDITNTQFNLLATFTGNITDAARHEEYAKILSHDTFNSEDGKETRAAIFKDLLPSSKKPIFDAINKIDPEVAKEQFGFLPPNDQENFINHNFIENQNIPVEKVGSYLNKIRDPAKVASLLGKLDPKNAANILLAPNQFSDLEIANIVSKVPNVEAVMFKLKAQAADPNRTRFIEALVNSGSTSPVPGGHYWYTEEDIAETLASKNADFKIDPSLTSISTPIPVSKMHTYLHYPIGQTEFSKDKDFFIKDTLNYLQKMQEQKTPPIDKRLVIPFNLQNAVDGEVSGSHWVTLVVELSELDKDTWAGLPSLLNGRSNDDLLKDESVTEKLKSLYKKANVTVYDTTDPTLMNDSRKNIIKDALVHALPTSTPVEVNIICPMKQIDGDMCGPLTTEIINSVLQNGKPLELADNVKAFSDAVRKEHYNTAGASFQQRQDTAAVVPPPIPPRKSQTQKLQS